MAANSTVPCFPETQAVSNGALQGDDPLKFALPLLIIQIAVVLVVTRLMAHFFRPLRQPRVLAEIIGGVLLGPSGLGRNKAYMNALFPKSSLTLIDTVANMGLIYFLFMVGLELDLKEIRKSGKTALIVAFSGILAPFVGGIGIAVLLRGALNVQTDLAPFIVFLGVPIAITAFPVLVRIMAERRVLGTKLGRMVVPAAAINDVCAWILLAVGVALAGPSKSPATPVYVLLCGIGFVLIMLTVVKRLMDWIAQRVNGQVTVSEIYICITFMGVLLSAFMTDFIGIHPLFGAFVFGLVVPPEGHFAKMLIEKLEDFITVLMLPLFFASSGLKTNLGSISGGKGLGFLVLLVLTAAVGKIGASTIAGRILKLNLREAFAFGFLMNTKGLVELIVLNIGLDLGVFDDEIFAILVLMCLILMFFTTPAVIALYKPARNPVPYTLRKLEGNNRKKDELRILACVHGTRCIPALLNLVESCRVTSVKRTLKLFPLHLIELTERTLSVMNLSRTASHDAKPLSSGDDAVLVAFEAYGHISKVSVKLLSAVSQLADMHHDICNSAEEKRTALIILPYSVYLKEDGPLEQIVNPGLRTVNQRVMQNAPCSVCVLVDRGPWSSTQLSDTTVSHKAAVIFFGGPDDREALAFGYRLAQHPCIKLSVIRFIQKGTSSQVNHVIDIDDADTIKLENKRDEDSLALIKTLEGGVSEKDSLQSICYDEQDYEEDPAHAVVSLVNKSDYLLLLVGRQTNKVQNKDNLELGVVGDALANARGEMMPSLLVIQQHNSTSTALSSTCASP